MPEEESKKKPDRSRIGKSNVRKGKTLERRVAHLLTDWTGVEFRRRRVEGRDATVVERESTADVIPVKGMVHCSIEAKSGHGFSLDALLSSHETTIFTSWWHQATYDCTILETVFKRLFFPMLFFKPHANFDWVAVDQRLFLYNILKPSVLAAANYAKSLEVNQPIWFPSISYGYYHIAPKISLNVSHSKNNKVFESLQLPSLYFCRWKDFASNIDPTSFFVET